MAPGKNTSRALILSAIVASLGLYGCGNEPPAVDLTGVWVGSVSVAGGDGRIMLDLVQTDGHVSGGLELVTDSNIGIACSGSVHGYTLELTPRDASDSVSAKAVGDTLTGTIVSGDQHASWQATRLDTRRLTLTDSITPLGHSPAALTVQGGHLWFYDSYDNSLHEQGLQGEELTSLQVPINTQCQEGFAGCADSLACGGIHTIDLLDPTSGARSAQLSPPNSYWPGLACAADGSFWDANENRAAHFSASGTSLNDFAVPGLASALALDGVGPLVLMSFPHVIVRLDATTGAPLAAYELPELAVSTYVQINSLAYDGKALWTLVTRYQGATSTTTAEAYTLP